MILLSNHLQGLPGFIVPPEAVIRINMAWLATPGALAEAVAHCGDHPVFLDYPYGRRKPPAPAWTLEGALAAVQAYRPRCFAVSNVEEPDEAAKIQAHLPMGTWFVPKIETHKGVENLEEIVSSLGTACIMLDTEDLFTDKPDPQAFSEAVERVHRICAAHSVEVLRLYGVVFSTI